LNQKPMTPTTTNKAPTMTTTPVALSRSTRIPIKTSKSHNQQLDSLLGPTDGDDSSVDLVNETIGLKIRREELELMQFEETRRYLVIQEKLSSYGTQQQQQQQQQYRSRSAAGGGASSSSNPSSHAPPPKSPAHYNPFQGTNSQYQSVSLSPAAAVTPQHHRSGAASAAQLTPFLSSPMVVTGMNNVSSLTRQMSSAGGGAGAATILPNSPIVNPKNLDAIISWLAFPRNVFLRDRHTQQEYTIVIDSSNDEIIDSKRSQQQDPPSSSFLLKWFEINPRGGGGGPSSSSATPILDERSVLRGYVYLQDITNLQLSGRSKDTGSNLLVLQLSSAARALKSSGGRTVLHLEFSSESECSKYFQGIHSLQSYKRQQQPLLTPGGRGMQ
jgi:hypothetical protein